MTVNKGPRFCLPMLPPDQNRLLFPGAAPPLVPRYLQGEISAELRRFLEFDWQGYQETPTKLPRIQDSPRRDLEALAMGLWGASMQELDLMVRQAPPLPSGGLEMAPGWTFYPADGSDPVAVDYPTGDTLVFDTETYVRGGSHAVMAACAGLQGFWVWLHPALCHQAPIHPEPLLIPLGPRKLLVGHNVLYDLARCQEQYSPGNQNRHGGLCTMALHNSMASLGGDQVLRAAKAVPQGARLPWLTNSCSSGLAACTKFYRGEELDKDARNLFLGPWEGIHGNRDALVQYLLGDVRATWLLLIPLLRKYRQHCPSPLSLVGIIEASLTVIPLVPDYHERVAKTTETYETMLLQQRSALVTLASETVLAWEQGRLIPESDPWLRNLDWTPAKSGKNKGKPAWYRGITAKSPITTASLITPYLTRTTWKGEPVQHTPALGWHIVVNGEPERLPHPDGAGKNVGSPFAKHFAQYAEDGALSTQLEGDRNLPKEITRVSYWKSFKARFEEVLTYPLADRVATVPVTSLKGTLTGRQVHGLWLTAAHCKPGRLGTDLMHAIQAPEGWDIVAWDEDTEEVRIAALWGDLDKAQGLGATAMSQVAFLGDKDKGTDAHSVTAGVAGISRQDAKTANFRDIYGGGAKTQAQALSNQHPDWPSARVEDTVRRIMEAKRGLKQYGRYQGGTDSDYHNKAQSLAKLRDFRLPATDRLIPNVINPKFDTAGAFHTSRINFPVQGSGADILDCTLVAVAVLAREAGIPASAYGHVLCRHDEFVFMVKQEYSTQFTEVAQSAHAWAWAILLEGLGFNWMPSPLARLSGVSVDKVYRKAPDAPIEAGYGLGWDLPHGVEHK